MRESEVVMFESGSGWWTRFLSRGPSAKRSKGPSYVTGSYPNRQLRDLKRGMFQVDNLQVSAPNGIKCLDFRLLFRKSMICPG